MTMSVPQGSRTIDLEQAHIGATVVAGLIALITTCLTASLAMTLTWHLVRQSSWLFCLFLPALSGIMLTGFLILNWGERRLARIWPSGRQLVLDQNALTLRRGKRVINRIDWDQPFGSLRWRLYGRTPKRDFETSSGRLCLACRLIQDQDGITLYSHCSPQEWRRVPGWKQFSLFDGTPIWSAFPGGHLIRSTMRRRSTPSQRGAGSLPEADPHVVGPAELNRRRKGWNLSFEDFCAVLDVVESHMRLEEHDD